MIKEISKLDNNIEYIYRQNEDTPRMAVCLNFSINKPEKKAGIFSLLARLLLQGTKNYNSEELANEFENYAIDFSCNIYPNYLRFKLVCLNEDFDKALELLNDVIINSTFEEFEKERLKLRFEIPADLDSPRMVAMDAYGTNLFKDHYYGNGLTRILENIDSITRDDVVEAYNSILSDSKKSIAIVGALEKEDVLPKINATIGKIPQSTDNPLLIEKPELNEAREVTNHKKDLNQAHIIKGWLVPAYGEIEHSVLILLNIILGSSGLSSRLFLELRDKKGLAYVVRSVFEPYKLAGNFMIYIATEPGNIETCLKGFDEEINKIRTIKVSEKELADAKNNFIGKCALVDETNIQQATAYAKFGVLGLGFDFGEKIKEQVKAVSAEDVLNCAQKFFNENYVISITKP